MPRGDIDMVKRLVSLVGLGLLFAGLLASPLTTDLAYAGSKVEGGKITNRAKTKESLAVGMLKGTAIQGSTHVENSTLKNATLENNAEMERSLCVGMLKGTCEQGSLVIK
jgi:hypothetical protein